MSADIIKAVPPADVHQKPQRHWGRISWWDWVDWLSHRGFAVHAMPDGNVRLSMSMAANEKDYAYFLVGADLTPDDARLLAQWLLDAAALRDPSSGTPRDPARLELVNC